MKKPLDEKDISVLSQKELNKDSIEVPPPFTSQVKPPSSPSRFPHTGIKRSSLSPPSREELKELIERYGPVVFMHPDEKYHMTSVDWFLPRAWLVNSETGEKVQATMDNLPQGRKNKGKYHLELKDDGSRAGDLSLAKAYVHAKAQEKQTDLQFWFFYAYNGPGTAKIKSLVAGKSVHSGKANLAPLGEHEGDWEHITLRIDHANFDVDQVYLSQHSGGVWLSPEKLERKGEKFVIYSSKNGHASYGSIGKNYTEKRRYPVPGTLLGSIQFALINETKKGVSVDCSKTYELISADFLEKDKPTEPKWVNFLNRWGKIESAHLTEKAISEILAAALGPILGSILSHSILGKIAGSLLTEYVKRGKYGPTGPKAKGSWDGRE